MVRWLSEHLLAPLLTGPVFAVAAAIVAPSGFVFHSADA